MTGTDGIRSIRRSGIVTVIKPRSHSRIICITPLRYVSLHRSRSCDVQQYRKAFVSIQMHATAPQQAVPVNTMLDFVLTITSGLLGLVGGWLLRHCTLPRCDVDEGTADDTDSDAKQEKVTEGELFKALQRRTDQVASAADRVRSLTMRVAADVDDHNLVVQHASRLLNDSGSDEEIRRAVMELATANEKMQRQLEDARARMDEQAARLQTAEEKARTDGLTKLQNRRAFDEYLETQFRAFQNGGSTSSIMLIDVDNFKQFNDTHGHLAGDEVLKRVANLLQSRLADHAFIARYGGEEFAVVFAGKAAGEVEQLAEETRARIGEREIEFGGTRLRVTASGGLAELEPKETIDRWIERADEALYISKEAGRNCAHRMQQSTTHLMTKRDTESSASPTAEGVIQNRDESWLQDVVEDQKPREDDLAPTIILSGRDLFRGLQPPEIIEELPAGDALAKIGRQQYEVTRRKKLALSVLAVNLSTTDDTTLECVANALKANSRAADRFGLMQLDQFLLWMPGATAAEAATRAEQVHQTLARSENLVSGGAIEMHSYTAHDGESFEQFLERARANNPQPANA